MTIKDQKGAEAVANKLKRKEDAVMYVTGDGCAFYADHVSDAQRHANKFKLDFFEVKFTKKKKGAE